MIDRNPCCIIFMDEKSAEFQPQTFIPDPSSRVDQIRNFIILYFYI